MTEQVNPTAEEPQAEQNETNETQATEEKTAQPATPTSSPAQAARPAQVSLRDRTADDLDDEDYDVDYDEDDEDYDEDEEEDLYVEGPAEYVERERGGRRSRRIGSDVRLEDIDYKNIPLLSRFLDRRGRILSRRKTRVSAKVQRRIVKAIKHARHLALLPYTADQTRIVRKRR